MDWLHDVIPQDGCWKRFSDSDWSGSKSHRRSTSAAIHVVNGTVVFSSSRGQKPVSSLSSAEAELNALVGAAADGIYLERCLEFLSGESVTHHCLVDNSAALRLCHKKAHLTAYCRKTTVGAGSSGPG